MLKRTFHDLIEIKNKIAKLEKSKASTNDKKRRRIITVSSSSESEHSDTESKCMERKDAATSSDKPGESKSPAQSKSRRKLSDAKAKASRGGKKDSTTLTAPAPDSTTGAAQPGSKKGKKSRSIKK